MREYTTNAEESAYEDGYQDAKDDDLANYEWIYECPYCAENAEAVAQRDAAWEYLRDKDIHILHELCWCGPTRHVVV